RQAQRIGDRHGIQKIDRNEPQQISGEEPLEAQSGYLRELTTPAMEQRAESEHESDVVELRRVAADAIAEVDRPGQIRRQSEGIVMETGEKAADTADCNAGDQRKDERVTGGLATA